MACVFEGPHVNCSGRPGHFCLSLLRKSSIRAGKRQGAPAPVSQSAGRPAGKPFGGPAGGRLFFARGPPEPLAVRLPAVASCAVSVGRRSAKGRSGAEGRQVEPFEHGVCLATSSQGAAR